MNLPPKAINALVAIKARLEENAAQVSARVDPFVVVLEEVRVEVKSPARIESQRKTPDRLMRHARIRNSGYQRFQRQMNERVARL